MRKTLSQEEIDRLRELERNIWEAKQQLLKYKYELKQKYGCKPTLGIVSYTVNKRQFYKKPTSRDYCSLAWISSWEVLDAEIVPRYSHVSADGKYGNELCLWGKDNFEFAPLEDTTLDEAKKILKEVKKNKPTNDGEENN